MSKFLILIVALIIGYALWRGFKRGDERRETRGAAADGERMVDCSQCGVHLPVSEAVESKGRYFCSEEHRRLFSA